jgi:hypothetical protein
MDGDSFYRRLDDDYFEATQWTRGPWSPKHQHAGPPSALVAGRLAEMLDGSFRIVRMAIEVTRPVPIGKLRLERSFRREGRNVRAMMGLLFDEQGKLVLTADALAIAEVELDLGHVRPAMDEKSPSDSVEVEFPFFDPEPGYAAAMELRFGRGKFGDGDVMAWMRMRIPLLPGAEPSPLERVMTAADSSNGVSQRLSTHEYSFLNPDLAVVLHRLAEGEWIGLGARTDLDQRGIGVADARLYDEAGPIGRAVQTLLIRTRE